MAKDDTTDRIRVGHIAGAHGIRGEVLIKSYTDEPGDIGVYGLLETDVGTQVSIVRCRVAKKGVVATLEAVRDRNAAEALKGTKLYIHRSQLPDTDHEEWYVADLIGLAVRDEAGTVRGSIATVHDFGAGELLELKLDGMADTVFVPFTKDAVPHVHLGDGYVTVSSIDDLLSSDTPEPDPKD